MIMSMLVIFIRVNIKENENLKRRFNLPIFNMHNCSLRYVHISLGIFSAVSHIKVAHIVLNFAICQLCSLYSQTSNNKIFEAFILFYVVMYIPNYDCIIF